MAKQALKEEFEFPAGGIADFYMEDHEIEALEKAEAEEEFGSAGIATFQPLATRMASYGRYGDDTVAHVETGELIVPKALIDQNPKLKASIFNHLRELGVEDPERYVVGSGANSLNPETGMPEFFLKKVFRSVKKTASKIAKGVKKGLKSVGKVLKKAAPIVLPIALSFTPLGAIYGAALGSGIGSLIQGKSLKQSLKSALIAGATGALFKGFQGKGTFMENVSAEAANPMGRISETATNIGEGKIFGSFSGGTSAPAESANLAETSVTPAETSVTPEDIKLASTEGIPAGTEVPTTTTPVGQSEAGQFLQKQAQAYDAAKMSPYGPDAQALTRDSMFTSGVPAETTSLTQTVTTPEPTGFIDTAKSYAETAGDYLFRGGESQAAIDATAAAAEKTAIQDTLTKFGYSTFDAAPTTVQNAAIEAGKAAVANAQPGMLATYGPSLALGTAAAGYGLSKLLPGDAPEDEPTIEEMQGPTGADLIAQRPGDFLIPGNPMLSTGDTVVATNYGMMGQPKSFFDALPYLRPDTLAAEGGEIFPRRVGGIMPNEGIPGQDSVRAMLMPGEFVMTTNAVKGLGNGNNQVGINRMYDMMRGLEAKGKAMA